MLHFSLRNAIGDQYPSRGIYTPLPKLAFLESLFDDNLGDYGARFELTETEGGDYQLTLPLPGFKRDEISIEVDNRTLTVTAKNAKHEITRSLDLLETIDTEAIGAALEDGVLTITLKRNELTKPRKIAIT